MMPTRGSLPTDRFRDEIEDYNKQIQKRNVSVRQIQIKSRGIHI